MVLDNLIPELSHKKLEIPDGGAASWSWIEMVESDDPEEKREKAEALRIYCERDTRAMVELHRYLAKD